MAHLPKRFWKDVTLRQDDEGFYGPALDGRSVKLTGGYMLAVSSRPLAEALVEEWSAIAPGETISPDKIPLTRIAGSQIEQIAPYEEETREALFAFGLDDALCYVSEVQDPAIAALLKEWMSEKGRDFILPQATDLTPLEHSEGYRKALKKLIASQSIERLTVLRIMAPLLSSFWLPLAMTAGILTFEEAFAFGFADEYAQLEEWGHDDEMVTSLEQKKHELADAMRYWEIVQSAV
ncbi:ATP12 chaperone protein [Acetobacteraceae bacterium ESL0709]|nr:ATP12 chaperone protein [Acetobacteraceae bacterium ESL0697]MDF7677579.1 ATP12 chaperone protein [Acetobacteraceae bacterium ESL0709]